jgi:signal transduction histidine kinase
MHTVDDDIPGGAAAVLSLSGLPLPVLSSMLELERSRRIAAERRQQRAELLFSLASSVLGAEQVEQVFDSALSVLCLALNTDRAAILTYDDSGLMRFRSWRGLSEGYRDAVEGHSPWPRNTVSPQPVLIHDVGEEPTMRAFLRLFRAEKIGALAFIPLVTNGRLIGKFMVYFEAPKRIGQDELDTARAIAHYVAGAVTRFSSRSELERSVRFNEMFTAMLGHDLRNPLSGILTSAELLIRRSDGSVEQTKPLHRIVRSGHRMAKMIDQLLDFTRLRIGSGIPLSPARCHLLGLVREVVEELEGAYPQWRIKVDSRGDCKGVWDADRLQQVFSNLVANALQHGDPELGLRIVVDGTDPGHVYAEVTNHGAVPQELLPHLFDPMSAGARPKTNAQGLGLGLFITKQIVLSHGGNIDAHSSEGITTMSVMLPRARSPAV